MRQIDAQWPAGIKRTKQRAGLLEILARADKPLSAQEICAALQQDAKTGKSGAWLSTVYRILDFFAEKELVTKTGVMNNEITVYELNRHKHRHYAVCMNCRKIIPMEDCPMEHFTPKLEDKKFRVVGHNLEVFGFCRECAAGRDRAAIRNQR
jgi:Fur family ferric uptake transcriptional regulator